MRKDQELKDPILPHRPKIQADPYIQINQFRIRVERRRRNHKIKSKIISP